MKYERAKNYLETLREEEFRGRYIMALTGGIEAIEKQIPQKTIYREYNGQAGYCPICKSRTGDDSNYCWNCGQKLDWSE